MHIRDYYGSVGGLGISNSFIPYQSGSGSLKLLEGLRVSDLGFRVFGLRLGFAFRGEFGFGWVYEASWGVHVQGSAWRSKGATGKSFVQAGSRLLVLKPLHIYPSKLRSFSCDKWCWQPQSPKFGFQVESCDS